jgi:hypothetical protein
VLTFGCARLSVGASPRAAPALPLHSLEPGLCAGGRTVAVIGTPLSKAYPAEHAASQERIWREHLLLTPFREGATVFRSNFPIRNRVMAAVSDATVIIEASDTSRRQRFGRRQCSGLAQPP